MERVKPANATLQCGIEIEKCFYKVRIPEFSKPPYAAQGQQTPIASVHLGAVNFSNIYLLEIKSHKGQ